MKRVIVAIVVLAAIGAGIYWAPLIEPRVAPLLAALKPAHDTSAPKEPAAETARSAAPAVSVIKAAPAEFTETVAVSGSLVPRDEILVAPEVEGFRVLELLVDEGDRVKKGDVLATLVQESLDAQLAQNDAGLARAEAAISRARSQIVETTAKLDEAGKRLYVALSDQLALGEVDLLTGDVHEIPVAGRIASLAVRPDGGLLIAVLINGVPRLYYLAADAPAPAGPWNISGSLIRWNAVDNELVVASSSTLYRYAFDPTTGATMEGAGICVPNAVEG